MLFSLRPDVLFAPRSKRQNQTGKLFLRKKGKHIALILGGIQGPLYGKAARIDRPLNDAGIMARCDALATKTICHFDERRHLARTIAKHAGARGFPRNVRFAKRHNDVLFEPSAYVVHNVLDTQLCAHVCRIGYGSTGRSVVMKDARYPHHFVTGGQKESGGNRAIDSAAQPKSYFGSLIQRQPLLLPCFQVQQLRFRYRVLQLQPSWKGRCGDAQRLRP